MMLLAEQGAQVWAGRLNLAGRVCCCCGAPVSCSAPPSAGFNEFQGNRICQHCLAWLPSRPAVRICSTIRCNEQSGCGHAKTCKGPHFPLHCCPSDEGARRRVCPCEPRFRLMPGRPNAQARARQGAGFSATTGAHHHYERDDPGHTARARHRGQASDLGGDPLHGGQGPGLR